MCSDIWESSLGSPLQRRSPRAPSQSEVLPAARLCEALLSCFNASSSLPCVKPWVPAASSRSSFQEARRALAQRAADAAATLLQLGSDPRLVLRKGCKGGTNRLKRDQSTTQHDIECSKSCRIVEQNWGKASTGLPEALKLSKLDGPDHAMPKTMQLHKHMCS